MLRLCFWVAVSLWITAASALAENVLYCVDANIAGFKWNDKGEASIANYVLSRFTVKIGPDQQDRFHLSEGERLITQTSDGEDRGLATIYKCQKQSDTIVCNSGTETTPWLFATNRHYVRAFLAGGPPTSRLDPNIAIAYGTCTNF